MKSPVVLCHARRSMARPGCLPPTTLASPDRQSAMQALSTMRRTLAGRPASPWKSIGVALAAVLVTGSPAHAQQAQIDKWLAGLPHRFALADTNKDGRLTREEARQGLPGIYKRFDQIDTERRGWVTLDEIRQAIASRGQSTKSPTAPKDEKPTSAPS